MSAGEPATPPDWPVWVGGEVLPFAEARWPLADVGLLFGRAVFTTAPWQEGRALFWRRHTERLLRDCAAFGLPLDLAELGRALAQLAPHIPAARVGALRVHVSAGPQGVGSHLALLPRPVSIQGPPLLARAGAAWTAGDPLARHKHVGRLARHLALSEAHQSGADDVLLEDGAGGVVGASAACLLVRLGERVVAPGAGAGALEGVARALLADSFPGERDAPAGKCWSDRAVRPDELERADEVVLLGSVSGVRGARGLLGRGAPLPGAEGALARALGAHWRELRKLELAGGAEDP